MHCFDRAGPFRVAAVDLGLEKNLQRADIHSPSEMRDIFEKLEGWMRLMGYSRRDLFAVKLALLEAVANAFEHGNRCDPAKLVRIAFLVTGNEVLVRVEDQGQGFDPLRAPCPGQGADGWQAHGRGLFLMRAYSTWVSWEPPGNRVVLCKVRSRVPTAPPGEPDSPPVCRAHWRLTVEGPP